MRPLNRADCIGALTADELKKSRMRTRALFRKTISSTLSIPEKMTVSQWAERYRVLDESSNFQGRWSNDITPYMVGVMDAFNDPYIQEINFCKSTQLGGTEGMMNALGWIITQDPSPTMVIYDSDELEKDTSNDRIRPSLTLTPEIQERFYAGASKELNLKFRGMHIYLRGSKSPGKLASKAIKYLFFDEIDKMSGATKKEASPYSLAKERTRTYVNTKKIFTCSTPTYKTNYVWTIHESADEQREYFMPCPHCGACITFKWAQIKFAGKDDGENGTELDNRARSETAVYACQECGCAITDRDKIGMLRAGEWRAVKRRIAGRARSVSFHINALYSRFLTWKDIALEFLDSKDDPTKLQNFVNSWLAEPWEDTKLKTSADLVMERQTDLPEFFVPDWCKLLTAGVDVQESCLYYTIRAWGDYMTSQNITHGQCLSFADVANAMNTEYQKADGTKCVVNLCLVDSGDQTDYVYDFVAQNAEWALPVKGVSSMQGFYKLSTVDRASSKAVGMSLVLADGGKYKDLIASRMRREHKNGSDLSGRNSGSWMVYQGCDMEYAQQVTAEHKITERTAGGREVMTWVQKTSHAANHYLDCEVYCAAAADILEVRRLFLENAEPTQEKLKKEEKQNKPADTGGWLQGGGSWL